MEIASAGKSWVTQCPHCKWWQSKPAINFGKEVKNSRCIFCNRKYKVAVGGIMVDSQKASRLVKEKNMGDNELIGFRRFRYRRGPV